MFPGAHISGVAVTDVAVIVIVGGVGACALFPQPARNIIERKIGNKTSGNIFFIEFPKEIWERFYAVPKLK